MAAKPRGGSAATVRTHAPVADASQRGPLQRIMASFKQTWRGGDAFSAHVKLLGKVKGSPAVQRDVGGVIGLHVCRGLSNALYPTPTAPNPYPNPNSTPSPHPQPPPRQVCHGCLSKTCSLVITPPPRQVCYGCLSTRVYIR